MKVLYILNESLFYKRMTLFSIHTLRRYEPTIPVEILLVRDGGANSRDVKAYESYDWGLGFIDEQTFPSACRNLQAKIVEVEFDNGEETGFHSSLRGAFVNVEGEERTYALADIERANLVLTLEQYARLGQGLHPIAEGAEP